MKRATDSLTLPSKKLQFFDHFQFVFTSVNNNRWTYSPIGSQPVKCVRIDHSEILISIDSCFHKYNTSKLSCHTNYSATSESRNAILGYGSFNRQRIWIRSTSVPTIVITSPFKELVYITFVKIMVPFYRKQKMTFLVINSSRSIEIKILFNEKADILVYILSAKFEIELIKLL